MTIAREAGCRSRCSSARAKPRLRRSTAPGTSAGSTATPGMIATEGAPPGASRAAARLARQFSITGGDPPARPDQQVTVIGRPALRIIDQSRK